MMVDGKAKTIGRDVTVKEVMETVEKDRQYYRRSGGGMTLSGGESLCQPEFARDLLRAAKESGINTAMESMGCASYEIIESILPYLDTYLLDIKHVNPTKHKEYTGKSNELMLENAKKIAASGMTKLVIRVPVIPGFNDSVAEIESIARFSDALPGVEKIHLLPYHRLGQDKYQSLGREYLMGDVLPPTNEKMETLRQAVIRVSKLDCQIGG
jgi:pyruvate formate lyase activating enzyme